MAYYAAVISLKQTIKRLLDSSHISILPSDREIIKFTYEKVYSLQLVLSELESRRKHIRGKRVESLRERIRDVAYKLEDALDSHISDQFLSRSERPGDGDSNSLTFALDVPNVVLKQEIKNFANKVKKIEDECKKLSNYSSSEQGEGDEADSSRIGLVGMETKMVGPSHEFSHLKRDLLTSCHEMCTFVICGMAGIGKTTMAKRIYYDPEVYNHFDCRLWINVGQNYQFMKIMLGLLAQLHYDVDNFRTHKYDELPSYLYRSLLNRRYLIVLDDVWDSNISSELMAYLPIVNGNHILLTTRLQQVARNSIWARHHTLRFLNEEESWCLLCEKVFGEKPCPYLLEKAGKKIAKNCDGLPLLIVTVADLLAKAEKTLEYWTKIAEGEDKSIFIEANDTISSTLLRSYKYLRQYSKACLLYMGVFPSKCEIPTSKLYNLWIAEDITVSVKNAKDHLSHLVYSNLVLAHQDAAIGGIKTCSLHSSLWHACLKQSLEEKFLQVINSSADKSKEGAISWRRFCIYNNVLFGIKKVFDSMESISGARSLICSGPNYQYPISICSRPRLLKVLDILSIRFYTFPIEVLKLIHLRYLALTYNGKVPPSISKLQNLEYLIVHRHLSIKFLGDWSYLPLEIWNLQKLRHLQVMGNCLPYLCNALLPELLKLSGITTHSCTKEIFEKLPNLKKLGIQIELAPNSDASEPLSCFDHLSHLDQLESLKCVIVNPNPVRPQLVAPPAFVATFPSNLEKLSLSGFGYPWNYMRVIGKLQNLRVLKLRSYAFRGPEWEVHKDEFCKLRYLLLEDLDLVRMTFHDNGSIPKLDKLIIKHCYKLKRMPIGLKYLMIELVDSPLIAKHIQRHREATSQGSFTVHINSSWEDGKRKA